MEGMAESQITTSTSKSPDSPETWAKYRYSEWIQAHHEARRRSARFYDMVRGNVVDPAIKSALKDKGLQALDLNIAKPKLMRVMGAEREARAGIKAKPLRRGRIDTAETMTKMFEWVRVNSPEPGQEGNGFSEIADAFFDALVTEIGGWLEIVWSNDNDPWGQPVYRRINPFHVVYDPNRRGYGLSRDRAILKSWFASADDVIRDFPDKGKEIEKLYGNKRQRWYEPLVSAWASITGSQSNLDDEFIDRKDNLIRVIEAQRRDETVMPALFDLMTQELMYVDDQEERQAMITASDDGTGRSNLVEVDVKKDKIRIITTLGGDEMLLQDEDADVQNGQFSLFPIWAFNIGDKPTGMMTDLEAPQELYWKQISSALQIVNSSANPIWLIPKGSVTKKVLNEIEKYGARTGFVVEYDPLATAGREPRRDMNPTPPMATLDLAERAQVLVDVISGIGQNAVGRQDSSGESGELVKTRVSEAMAILEPVFDNKQRTEVMIHNYLIAVFQQKFTTYRILQFTDMQGGVEKLELNVETAHGIMNDMKTGEYGIAIEKAETRYFREGKFLKLLSYVEKTGVTPAKEQLLIDAFDELNEEEKTLLKNEIKMMAAQQMMGQMQPELDAQQQRADAQVKGVLDSLYREDEQDRARADQEQKLLATLNSNTN